VSASKYLPVEVGIC